MNARVALCRLPWSEDAAHGKEVSTTIRVLAEGNLKTATLRLLDAHGGLQLREPKVYSPRDMTEAGEIFLRCAALLRPHAFYHLPSASKNDLLSRPSRGLLLSPMLFTGLRNSLAL
jgi:hypothetical protein